MQVSDLRGRDLLICQCRNEPSLYGAVKGSLQVDPGWTFVFNPYVTFEGLREGFGAKAQYTLISHLRDQIL